MGVKTAWFMATYFKMSAHCDKSRKVMSHIRPYLYTQTQNLALVVEPIVQPYEPLEARHRSYTADNQRSPSAPPIPVLDPFLHPATHIFLVCMFCSLFSVVQSADALCDKVSKEVYHQCRHELRPQWPSLMDRSIGVQRYVYRVQHYSFPTLQARHLY